MADTVTPDLCLTLLELRRVAATPMAPAGYAAAEVEHSPTGASNLALRVVQRLECFFSLILHPREPNVFVLLPLRLKPVHVQIEFPFQFF